MRRFASVGGNGVAGWLAAAVLLLTSLVAAQAPAPAGTDLAGGLSAAVTQLNRAVNAADVEHWRLHGQDRNSLQAARDSVARNLSTAVPGLLTGWRQTPQDLSAAFRLYRDLDAVYAVASKLDDSGTRAGDTSLSAPVGQLHDELERLGDYIQATAKLQYASLQQRQERAQQAAAVPAAPRSLVINDANAETTHRPARRRTRTKKAPATGSNQTTNGGSASQPTH